MSPPPSHQLAQCLSHRSRHRFRVEECLVRQQLEDEKQSPRGNNRRPQYAIVCYSRPYTGLMQTHSTRADLTLSTHGGYTGMQHYGLRRLLRR